MALFYTMELTKNGVYVCYFYINGTKTPVIIDDYLPCDQDGKLVFARCSGNEIWVCLLEKAWAKLHGSYSRIHTGSPSFAYTQICGLAGNLYKHHDHANNIYPLWKLLKSQHKRGFELITTRYESKDQEG